MDKSFENQYIIEVPKLDIGVNEDKYIIDDTFFGHFEYSLIEKGNLSVDARIHKTNTHLDAEFRFEGYIELNCDRCLEPYKHALDFEIRVVFSYSNELEFDTDEVILVDRDDPIIYLANDFYEFISLQIPLRKVPDDEVHICPPEVLALLVNDSAEEEEDGEETIDPRWEALKKLKNKEG